MNAEKEGAVVGAVGEHPEKPDRQQVKIMVNNKHYTTSKNPMTVAELKGLVGLPLEFNCSKIEHGESGPTLPNDLPLDLHPGDRFVINSGEDPS